VTSNTPSASVQLVAFDLDGTLVDSLRDLAESANTLLGELGAAPLEEDAIGRMVGDGAATLVRRVLAAAGRPNPPDALARFLAIYDARLLKYTKPYPGVATLLAALEGRVKLAVLTNKPLDATRRILDGLELARYFPAGRVVGGDGPFPRKPDPAGLQWLATAECAPIERTLLVGDSPMDWRTTQSAGARMCVARYGFGVAGFKAEDLGPDEWGIDTPLELLTLL
jgi:phosphoglycolate phosphatase